MKAGKARYIGASSMFAWQFCQSLYLAEKHGWTKFVSMQNHYNLLYREEEREMIPLCIDRGIALIPWSPLARGKLTRPWENRQDTQRANTDEFGKTLYARTDDADHTVVDRVAEVASKLHLPQAQVALAWMLGKPGITSPIIGATKPQHLTDAVAAVEVKLTEEDVSHLEEPYVPHTTLGFN